MSASMSSPFELVAPADRRPLLLIGAGLDGSGTARGESRAPACLRAAGLARRLGASDFGDLDVQITDSRIDPDAGIRGYRELLSASKTIADAVASSLAAGWRPILMGGCCSVLPGALAGARRHLGPIALVFVDGHLDLFDAETSKTGEVAGMDLAIVIGHGPHELTHLAGEAPLVEPADVIAVGDGDHQRRVSFRAPGPEAFSPDLRVIDSGEICARGARAVAAQVAGEVNDLTSPFWLHFDVDVVDAQWMPAVSFPVATGLSWSAVEDILGEQLRSPSLVGVSVAGFNPDEDGEGALGERVVEVLVHGLLGRTSPA